MRFGSRGAEGERQVQRYWDALVTGASPDDLARLAAPLDPTLVDLIARLRAGHHRRPPDPAFVAALERRVMDTFTRTQTVPIPLRPGRPGPRRDAPPVRPTPRGFPARPASRRRWAVAALAAAVLVLLALGLGDRAFRPAGPARPTTIPAAVAPATPVPEPTVETLLDTTIDEPPAGDVRVYVERWRFRPGPAAFTQEALAQPLLLGVDAGTVAGTVGGTEHALAAGDQVVVPAGQELVLRNAGPTEAVVVEVFVVPVAPHVDIAQRYDAAAVTQETPITQFDATLPAGPLGVTLERVVLPPGTALPPYVAGVSRIKVAAGVVGLTLEGEGMPTGWQTGRERELPSFVEAPALAPGWRVTLRNAGDEPLVLYRLTLAPAGAGTPTA